MIENENLLPMLLSKIIKIEDRNNNEIKFKKIDYVIKRRKFSSNKAVVILIDGIELKSNFFRNLFVTYKCRCGRNIKILFVKYIKKTHYWCQHCCQDPSFKEHFKANDIIRGKIIKQKRIIPNFYTLPLNKQNEYWKNHLKYEEFCQWLPFLVRINDKKIEDYKTIKYIPVIETYKNQIKYTSKVSFNNGKTFESLYSVSLKCSYCGKIFKKHLCNLRTENINDIRCGTCKLSNHIYKLKKYKDTSLTYQSNTEKEFLDKCFKYNIKVKNGLEIPYVFNNKKRTYISDYFLPDYKIIVELKGKNKFYRDDLKSGKIKAKNDAASNFCKKNNLKFKFIFTEDIDNFILSLLNERDSQLESNVSRIG